MNQRWKTVRLPILFCLLFSFLLLRDPKLASQGFQSGLQLCIQTVLPALFPFFVVCELLLACPLQGALLRRLAHILGMEHEKTALAVLLSWVGGYAVCARLANQLSRSGILTRRDENLLLVLGCCSSPGFVVGCVGGLLLGNLRLGILLYALQIAANLLCAALCLPFLSSRQTGSSPSRCVQPPISNGGAFPAALNSAVNSCLQVCGCVIFFRIAGAVIVPLLPAHPLVKPILSSILEISAGCFDFAAEGGQFALYGCCFCLSGLGLSVWAQISLLLQGVGSLRLLAASRVLHLLVFSAFVRIFVGFLPGSITAVYSTLESRVIPTHRLPMDAAFLVFCFVCAALYKVRQNFYN